jgi:DNA ligase (NAD+)
MYNAEHIKSLQEKTKQLLKNKDHINASSIEELREVLRFHEYRYYVQNDPLISDFEFDSLFKVLEKLEKADPALISPDSPTQRVGAGLIKEFPKAEHLVPMLSLENSYNEDDLLDWDRKVRELSGLENVEYCVEPKFDGASISLIYEDNLLTRGATRGDGVVGDDISTNIKQIRSIPLSAAFSEFGIRQAEIRGEVLMNKSNFKNYNEKLMEEGIPPLANPRNAAAGTLRMKDPAEVGRRNLEAFIYHLSFHTEKKAGHYKAPATHSDTLTMLWELGFRSPRQEMKVLKGIQEVIQHIRGYEEKRDDLDYEIDGMVVKVNNLALQEKLGMTSHHPRWAIAYKFKARQGTSKLTGVSFFVGRTGAITPTAQIEPVHVGGVTITNITLHNENYIKEKDLRIGDTVLVERSGDVIPQIVKSLPELRTGNEKTIRFPDHCPICNDKLYKTEDEAVWRCVNINCEAQVLERIIHFVSKDAMDIRSFGESHVRKFYSMGILKDIPGIYELDFEAIASLEGFGTKSIKNLKTAIENSKSQPLHRIIYALGIRYVGETTAKTLAHAIDDVMDLKDFDEEKLLKLEDVGQKVAGSIVEFFKNRDNIHMLEKLKDLGIQLRQEKKQQEEGSLQGQTFLFTGTLSKLKRSEAEERVERQGGKILGGVSSKLNFLVVGEDAGSKLEKAKKMPSIRIISEDDFMNLVPE